jgi:hypothetical protein
MDIIWQMENKNKEIQALQSKAQKVRIKHVMPPIHHKHNLYTLFWNL